MTVEHLRRKRIARNRDKPRTDRQMIRLNEVIEQGEPPLYVFPHEDAAKSIAMVEAGVVGKGIGELHSDWPRGSDKDQVVGIIGELAFQALLRLHTIPHIRHVSYLIEETERQRCDFETPFGTVEVKTASPDEMRIDRWVEKKQLQVNRMRWKGTSEVVAAMKVVNDSGDKVALMGWIYGSEVEKLPTRFSGKNEAYYIDHAKLPNDGTSFLSALNKVRNLPYQQWGVTNIRGSHVS